MAPLPIMGAMALTAAGSAISAAGTLASGNAARQAGQASYEAGVRNQQAMEFRARQEEQAAQESRASSQRQALEKRREAGFVQSKLIARAAASGGGVADPTVLDLSSNIAGQGEYSALFEMYKGENRARGLDDQARGSRFTGESLLYEGLAKRAEGEAKQRAAQLSAIGTIIGGAGSAYRQFHGIDRYG